MKSCFAVVFLSLLSLNVLAGVQKWVDADGKVHYSDTGPGEDTKTQSVRNFSGKDQANTPGYTPKSYAEREAEMKKAKKEKSETAEKQAQRQAQSEAKKSNCDAARQNAKTLEESPRIFTFDEKGERAYMDDSERARRLEEANKAISANCD